MTAGIRYFAFSILFLVSVCVFTWFTPPEASFGADMLVLGLTYALLLSMLGGVFGGVRLICQADGELDWGEGVAPTAHAMSSATRSVPTIA